MGPTDPGQPGYSPASTTSTPARSRAGIYSGTTARPTARPRVKVSHFADNFLGASHDFKFGVQYNAAATTSSSGLQRLHLHLQHDRPSTATASPTPRPPLQRHARGLGVFFDDTFRVNDRLTLNLGLRYDHSKASSRSPPASTSEGNPTGTTLPETRLLHLERGLAAARLQLEADRDGKTVLKGHYGRYYRGVVTGEYANSSGSRLTAGLRGSLRPGHGPVRDPTVSRSNENLGFDPDYSSPYIDQFIGSLERELRPSLGVQLQLRLQTRAQFRRLGGHHRRVRARALRRRSRDRTRPGGRSSSTSSRATPRTAVSGSPTRPTSTRTSRPPAWPCSSA